MEKPRLKGHALVMLEALYVDCECGWGSRMSRQQAQGRSARNTEDELMDRHSAHIAAVRRGPQEPKC